jgi:hypothetical protein
MSLLPAGLPDSLPGATSLLTQPIYGDLLKPAHFCLSIYRMARTKSGRQNMIVEELYAKMKSVVRHPEVRLGNHPCALVKIFLLFRRPSISSAE